MSWTLIQSQTLGASAASVTFSSIPQTYKTLKLLISPRGTTGNSVAPQVTLQFNGSGGTAYSDRLLNGNGSTTSTTSRSGNAVTYLIASTDSLATANTFGSGEFTIPNYASTTINKALSGDGVSENNGTLSYQEVTANLWASTSAITSIVIGIVAGSTSFAANSSFHLYGLS